jgi:hypothetical protein
MNTTVDARPKAENGVEKEALLDNRLEALLSRMDRLAASVEKSGVTIYQRRLNTSDIANPGKVFWFWEVFWLRGSAPLSLETARHCNRFSLNDV